jgi:HEAT repeat protein
MNMDAERAVPILKAVLARRDAGSVCLRRKAVWLVSQKRSSETSAILLNSVRSDPDREVRESAVFWLSQVRGEEAVTALDSILRDPKTDPEIQEKAIFALSQQNNPRAAAILRAFAERRDVRSQLRENAIFWLGQRRSPENAAFLKGLYAKLENEELKKKVIFSLSQMGGADNYRWMMDIALDQNASIEIRKDALFWAGQGRNVDVADLVRLYDSMKDRDMREQLIWVYSQRREDAALDKLFDIGKNDPDRELRKKAIFWIGQSRSPRAAQYLQDLINQ